MVGKHKLTNISHSRLYHSCFIRVHFYVCHTDIHPFSVDMQYFIFPHTCIGLFSILCGTLKQWSPFTWDIYYWKSNAKVITGRWVGGYWASTSGMPSSRVIVTTLPRTTTTSRHQAGSFIYISSTEYVGYDHQPQGKNHRIIQH